VNIAYYGSLPKTLKLTPPELMRNAGKDFLRFLSTEKQITMVSLEV
jgi:hypothetical protein